MPSSERLTELLVGATTGQQPQRGRGEFAEIQEAAWRSPVGYVKATTGPTGKPGLIKLGSVVVRVMTWENYELDFIQP